MAVLPDIVVEDIPDHLLVLCDPALQIDGVFYLTKVVEDIPDHLLVLGEPTLQVDCVFT